MQVDKLYRPCPNLSPLEDGDHLGVIVRSECHRADGEASAKLKLGLHILPEGSDHPYYLEHVIPVDWEPGSQFMHTLTVLRCLPLEGGYLNPEDLLGTAIIPTISIGSMVNTGENYAIGDIRAATEEEIARTNWDPEDNFPDSEDDTDVMDEGCLEYEEYANRNTEDDIDELDWDDLF
ncbi:hypothetical protein J23TS9_42710 [Paenibacillus sp. J23TS9]|uniref:hypothetical protein n=1 Tax=Paenibacillus sp. J23TS9 TaxID=2807193 RepID=UPI001B062E8F|nr:hypothetical protein [Paenibacillus sp. J23TS9]GIP29141.1 hypothetical protein J23TS9_42710 [Paenibacillus sp. J23TS9]